MREADFERLYAAHAPGLFSFLAYRCGDRVLAEDVLADTFERVLRARRGFDRRKASERTWLYTIALNVLRDQMRRSDAERRALDRAAPGERQLEDPHAAVESRDAVQRALERLSLDEREVVALRFGGDLSLKEIGGVLGEPVTTVEARLYRSLRKLREEF
jgi:RNA polymerase sigma-70 factor, ECF subfamily